MANQFVCYDLNDSNHIIFGCVMTFLPFLYKQAFSFKQGLSLHGIFISVYKTSFNSGHSQSRYKPIKIKLYVYLLFYILLALLAARSVFVH